MYKYEIRTLLKGKLRTTSLFKFFFKGGLTEMAITLEANAPLVELKKKTNENKYYIGY